MEKVKLNTSIPCRAYVQKGDMKIQVGWHFGKNVTLKKIENIAKEQVGMPWKIFLDDQVFERDHKKGEWYETM